MIRPAELPLNHRKAVYHLNLRSEEIADFIITVGDPARVRQVSQHFDKIEFKREHREFVTHTGFIGSHRLSVISTGIGMPNIDIVMTEIDALANIDLEMREIRESTKSLNIVRLGTTGGLGRDSEPGDIVISRYAVGFDSLLDYYSYELSTNLGDLRASLDNYLLEEDIPFFVAESCPDLIDGFEGMGTIGITATCSGFYGPQGRNIRLPLRYPDFLNKLAEFKFADLKITNLEMETAAILGLGRLFGHRCLSISTIVANRTNGTFTDNVQGNIDKLITDFLDRIPYLCEQSAS
ncbi:MULTISPECIES: nucleoside phosphorylase [unclassified Legionella]|uniref:nucleoside phosphorylase n=1 Tax=unclassified Legionella TaxID=2622702 RepID=UPI0010551BB0|nr:MULTISPECIES: nucleoside phosphorylase [unclassified Legionella]MDI9818783.1 nucleoside phosphorylase [Legionella sp. PL877]